MATPGARPARFLLPIAIAAALLLAGCLAAEDTGDDPTVTDASEEDAAVPVPPEPNALQSGTNGPCLDFNVLWDYPLVASPLDPHVEVAPGTAWIASSPDGYVQVDFYDADGALVGYGTNEGSVPESAAYGVVCVTVENDNPGVPAPAAEWLYQDGY